ncbi:hypothetical protein [Rhodococcus sp. (in: high G+C Gram-positive bacteria)]|uniref:hypothetical protein n=1 Tax=Rhodococcus sp. TaxID=1831 RepID=UPI002580CF2E|nr:hypothetical protein [Rhodococcus sp. (in: high G+C Gram-positive bacteria)]MBQ9051767.1 hypothetical protein [Rhodococcus sp. (in: high G+C Gram-positive bacteria)]
MSSGVGPSIALGWDGPVRSLLAMPGPGVARQEQGQSSTAHQGWMMFGILSVGWIILALVL